MLRQVAIGAMVVALMFAIGLRTDRSHLAQALRQRLALGLGVAVNLVAVPLLAWAAATTLPLPAGILTGFVLCAACPGGSSGPLFVSRAHGDLTIAVTLTISLSVLGVVTAPPTLSLILGQAIDLDLRRLIAPMILSLAAYQLLPLGLGMAMRRLWPTLAERLARPAERLANLLLLAVIVGLLVTQWTALVTIGPLGLAAAAALVGLTLVVGRLVAPRGRLVGRSLALIAGVRNLSLALLLSATWFTDPWVDTAVLCYGLFTMLLPFALASLWRGRSPWLPPSATHR